MSKQNCWLTNTWYCRVKKSMKRDTSKARRRWGKAVVKQQQGLPAREKKS